MPTKRDWAMRIRTGLLQLTLGSWVVALGLLATCPLASAKDIALTSTSAVQNADGRIEVFGTGDDGVLYHRWQMAGAPQAIWGPWEINSGGKTKDVHVARASSGQLVAVFLDDNRISIRRQATPNGGWLPETVRVGLPAIQLQLAKNEDGRLEIFALGNGQVFAFPQVVGGAIEWQDPRGLGGDGIRSIATAQGPSGRIVVAGLTSSGSVNVVQQLEPNGSWGNWAPLEGHDLVQVSMAVDRFGVLHLVALGGDAHAYRRSLLKDGSWTVWQKLSDDMFLSLRAITAQSGFVQLLALNWGGSLVSLAQTHGKGRSELVTWQEQWQPISDTKRAESLSFADVESSALLLANYGPAAGAVRLLSSEDGSSWDSEDWIDLGQPGTDTPPNLMVQLPCCLDSCPLFANFNVSTIVEALKNGSANTDLAALVTKPGATSVCRQSPETNLPIGIIGVWLNQSPSAQALRAMPLIDNDSSVFAMSVSETTIRSLADSRLPNLPRHFDEYLRKPVRNGPIYVESYKLHLSDLQPPLPVQACGMQKGARIALALKGKANLDPWGLQIVDVAFDALANLDLCVDLLTNEVRCVGATKIDSPTADAVATLGGVFLPWVSNFAFADQLSDITSDAEGKANAALGQCEITAVFPSRIPLPKDETADIPVQTLVIPYTSIKTQPGLGLVVRAGWPSPPVARAPGIEWTRVGRPTVPVDSPGKRNILVRFKFTDLRENIDIKMGSNVAGVTIQDVSSRGATIVYDAPPDDDPHHAYVARVALNATDTDGVKVNSEILVKLSRN